MKRFLLQHLNRAGNQVPFQHRNLQRNLPDSQVPNQRVIQRSHLHNRQVSHAAYPRANPQESLVLSQRGNQQAKRLQNQRPNPLRSRQDNLPDNPRHSRRRNRSSDESAILQAKLATVRTTFPSTEE
jgi:hypothetical protein